jgi:hypothetical protein
MYKQINNKINKNKYFTYITYLNNLILFVLNKTSCLLIDNKLVNSKISFDSMIPTGFNTEYFYELSVVIVVQDTTMGIALIILRPSTFIVILKRKGERDRYFQ